MTDERRDNDPTAESSHETAGSNHRTAESSDDVGGPNDPAAESSGHTAGSSDRGAGLLVRPAAHGILLIAFSAVVLLPQLGGRGLAAYDDAFYAQKAKEIFATGSWMTMHYNGRPEFSNPPAFMWLLATSYAVLGVSDLAAKLPSALFGILTVALIWHLGRTWFDDWVGFFAGLVLATTVTFTRYARRAMMDVTLSFFFCLAMLALLLALRRDRRFFLLWGAAISVCVLIKSVLGFFPAVVTAAFLVATRRWRTLFDPWLWAGSALVVAVGCSWYWHQLGTWGTEFLDFHFGWVILERGFDRGIDVTHGPGSYLRWIGTYYWPWLPVALVGLWRGALRWRGDEMSRLLILWTVIPLLTMEIMRSRVFWYIMPIFPALALIVGRTLSEAIGAAGRRRWSAGLGVLTLVAAPLFFSGAVSLGGEREVDLRQIAEVVRAYPEAALVGYGLVYHQVNNPLLFYSDRAAEPMYADLGEFHEVMRGDGLVLAVVPTEGLESLAERLQPLHVVVRGGERSLVANRPVRGS